MITVQQIKAARSLLDWRQIDLATKSGISMPAITKLERGVVSPRPFTLNILQQTFEKEGIEFTEGPGLRLTDNIFSSHTLTGKTAIPDLYDDIYANLKEKNGEVLLSGLDEELFSDYADLIAQQQTRFAETNSTWRGLICEGDRNVLSYIDTEKHYRWMSKELFTQMPHYVYGDRIAFVLWGTPIRVIIMHHKLLAETFRKQFELNWKNGKLPT